MISIQCISPGVKSDRSETHQWLYPADVMMCFSLEFINRQPEQEVTDIFRNTRADCFKITQICSGIKYSLFIDF